MTIHHHIVNLKPQSPGPNTQPLVLAIGNMDGVHLGHQALMKTTKALADANGYAPAALTFFPHPREYFNPALKPLTLMQPAAKIKALRNLGAERVIFAKFDHHFAQMDPVAFIEHFCVDTLGAHHIVTGNNFYFGKDRKGNVELLEHSMHRLKLGYTCVEPVHCANDEVISSSRIRQILSGGNISMATDLLGSPFVLEGRVGHGDKRGRTLGFPTANIPVHGLYLPAFGVYAVRAHFDGTVVDGVANLGIRPTFGDNKPRLEVHLFDWNDNLYSKQLDVELIHYLRPELKFDGEKMLIDQIHKDMLDARKFLSLNQS